MTHLLESMLREHQMSEDGDKKWLYICIYILQRWRASAQRRQSEGKYNTRDEGERTLDVSTIIDIQRRNKFNRLRTLLKQLFVAHSE